MNLYQRIASAMPAYVPRSYQAWNIKKSALPLQSFKAVNIGDNIDKVKVSVSVSGLVSLSVDYINGV